MKTVVLRRGRIVLRESSPTPSGGREAADRIAEGILGAARKAGEKFRGGSGGPSPVGVALPGFLDETRSRPILLSNLPELSGFPLKRYLERRTGLPVLLEADSNAGAYGEAKLGAGRGRRRVLYITLGTGVGAAMVVDGEIVRVSHQTVGQVAHLPLDPRGPRCPCGNRGCVESVLSARGILWRARRRGRRLSADARQDPEALVRRAESGSREACVVLRETGELLGAALALLANFLSPDRIVVGGGIAGAGDLLLAPAREAFRRRVHPRLRGSTSIAPSRLGRFAGAIGAALLAAEGVAPGGRRVPRGPGRG